MLGYTDPREEGRVGAEARDWQHIAHHTDSSGAIQIPCVATELVAEPSTPASPRDPFRDPLWTLCTGTPQPPGGVHTNPPPIPTPCQLQITWGRGGSWSQ